MGPYSFLPAERIEGLSLLFLSPRAPMRTCWGVCVGTLKPPHISSRHADDETCVETRPSLASAPPAKRMSGFDSRSAADA